ncbi:MAG: flagellin [Pirellulales bacterium]|nr:flagellin [Pirellulales bacterium]
MSRINTNVSSLVAQKALARSNNDLQTSLTRLSTGLRINKGKDDPAGLIASEILRSDIVATQRAITNSERANQIIATADSALSQVSSLLNDIRGLVSEAANSGALSEEQIAANQLQVDSSLEAIDRIAQTTSFQGRRLLDGSLDFLTSSVGTTDPKATGTIGTAVDAAATGSFGAAVDANATVTLSGGAGLGGLSFTAISAGSTLNGAKVEYVFDSGGTASATFASNTLTVTLTAGTTAANVATLVNALTGSTGISAAVVTAGTIFSGGAAEGDKYSATLAGGAFNNKISLSAVNGGAAYNATVTISISDAAARASFDTATNTLSISVSAAGNTAAVVSAINAGGVFQASAQAAAGLGVYAAGSTTSATTGGTNSNRILLSASTGGPTYSNTNVVIATSDAAARASYDTASNTLTISRSAAATSSQVATAINANGVFSATALGNGQGVLTAGTISAATTGGATGNANLSDLKIDQANFGTASSITVDVRVDRQATQSTLYYSGGTLSSDLILQVGGKGGFETFNFGTGSTVTQIRDAINLVSDATGVSANVTSGTVSGSVLRLTSVEFGSDAFVQAKALTGSFNTVNLSGTATDRTIGTDVSTRINGVQAIGNGLKTTLNTSTLDLSFTVNQNLADGDSFSFSITGGGANFQIGPDVVSNQQARLGIQGVSTSTLGGVSGKLYELRSGGAKDLDSDTKGAAKVVDEVISAVSGLRGRLGAFQKTTLETNITTLNDALENLTEAESSIRDADFAAESARLTRAQILVQSGTSVLQITNQNPQNILSLLR